MGNFQKFKFQLFRLHKLKYHINRPRTTAFITDAPPTHPNCSFFWCLDSNSPIHWWCFLDLASWWLSSAAGSSAGTTTFGVWTLSPRNAGGMRSGIHHWIRKKTLEKASVFVTGNGLSGSVDCSGCYLWWWKQALEKMVARIFPPGSEYDFQVEVID